MRRFPTTTSIRLIANGYESLYTNGSVLLAQRVPEPSTPALWLAGVPFWLDWRGDAPHRTAECASGGLMVSDIGVSTAAAVDCC